MKTILTLSIVAVLMSCGNKIIYQGDTANNKKNIIKFSKHIESHIENHGVTHFLTHVEPTYKKDQLGIALKNDTTQFVNEFFCGKNTASKHNCMAFNSIESIDLMEIIPQNTDTYILRYLIVNDQQEQITSEVFLFTDQKLYQLYSAAG